jgi:hypothetical protein
MKARDASFPGRTGTTLARSGKFFPEGLATAKAFAGIRPPASTRYEQPAATVRRTRTKALPRAYTQPMHGAGSRADPPEGGAGFFQNRSTKAAELRNRPAERTDDNRIRPVNERRGQRSQRGSCGQGTKHFQAQWAICPNNRNAPASRGER